MRRRFLAVGPIPEGWDAEELTRRLERVARAADAHGVHPLETLYSLHARSAITLVDAATEDDVRDAHLEAGLDVEVVPGDRIHTELLGEMRRVR